MVKFGALPSQIVGVPEIFPAGNTLTVTGRVSAVDVQLGVLVNCHTTLMLPDPAVVLLVTVIDSVPCPPSIVHPAGTLHMYSVFPPTGCVAGGLGSE